MRLSKEEIAKNGEKKTPVDELVKKHGDKYRSALEKAEKSTSEMVGSVKEAVKESDAKLPSSFYREVTATCNVYKDKIVQGTAVPDEFQKTLDEIKDAVLKGEFKQEAKTSTANKTQTAKTPKDTARKSNTGNTSYQKYYYGEDGKDTYVTTPTAKTEFGKEIAEKFYNFERSLEKGTLSVNAINSFKHTRIDFTEKADFATSEDVKAKIRQEVDNKLAEYEKKSKEKVEVSALEVSLLHSTASKFKNEITKECVKKQAPQAKKDEIFDDKAIQKSEERTAINSAWQEAKKAWIEEGKNGVLQHIADDYTKLSNLAQQSNTLQEFKDGFAKLDAEVKADAQNPKRVSKTYPKTEKYATKATTPKSEPQVSNEPEPTARQTQFGNGEDSAAMNELKANPPQNTQAVKQDNRVSYSRAAHRQTQPNA